MNRLDMSQEIAKRVPLLSKRDKDEWKNAEKIRREFVFDYPVSQIRSMTLDEYVIGKGRNNRSFCYRLEREMDSLGRILGATASKFGIYYGRTKVIHRKNTDLVTDGEKIKMEHFPQLKMLLWSCSKRRQKMM